MLILGILGFGILAGFLAQLIMGESRGFFRGETRVDWGRALIVGLAGSFVGGLLVSLLAGDGLALRPSGLIGSVVGAVILLAGDRLISSRD